MCDGGVYTPVPAVAVRNVTDGIWVLALPLSEAHTELARRVLMPASHPGLRQHWTAELGFWLRLPKATLLSTLTERRAWRAKRARPGRTW